MCIEIIQHDDVQKYVALEMLDGYNNPYVQEDIFLNVRRVKARCTFSIKSISQHNDVNHT